MNSSLHFLSGRGEQPASAGATPAPAPDDHTPDELPAQPTQPVRGGLAGVVVASLLVLLALVLVAGLGSVLVFEQAFAHRIYPHISIRGLPVGGLTRAEARARLHEHYAAFLQQPVVLRYGTSTWVPRSGEIGLQLAIDDAVERAFATGRHARTIDSLRAALALWERGLDLPLRVTIDQRTMQRYLLDHVGSVQEAATDAGLTLHGTLPVVLPSSDGRQVLIDATVHDMTAALQTLAPQRVALRTRPLAPVLSDAAVAAARQQVATLLQGPLVLQAGDARWQWPTSELATMVRVERLPVAVGTGDELLVSLNLQPIRAKLQPIIAETYQRGTYPRVAWNGGNLTILRQGTPGHQINEAQALEAISAALWGDSATQPIGQHPQEMRGARIVDLPFETVPVPSTSEDLAQLGIREVIGVGRSDFEDSEDYRITNIIAGMRLLHGILLAPGDEFSFNATIGSIGPQNGFVEGYAIVEERVQLEWGGGICQDSTTMFRAAFWAGLPITEWWNHSRYLSWYNKYGYGDYGDGPGIDSTIFLGGPDLRFVNDTDAWILIQAHANPTTDLAEVRIYGTRGGRTVEFGGADITYRDNKMHVAFTRIIKEHGVEVYRKTYWSTFK